MKTKYLWILLACMLVACEQRNINIIGGEEAALRKANSTVIYECNERLFAEENALQAIEAYVPTLREMGVNVLWLMPIHPRGEDSKAIGSPYCVRDYRAVDPKLGTLDDLKSLVATCHKNEMLVIMDWIANHTSWDNVWTTSHPEWYQGPSTADEQAWADVTFLNFDIPAVGDAMRDCMLYWIKEADIDGYRCDYAGGVPLDWWQSVNNAIRELKPNALMLAETSDARHYDVGFDLLYSWSYLYAIEELYSGNGTFNSLVSASNAEYNATPIGKERMRYVTTHDEMATKAPASIYRDAAGELSAFCLAAFMGGVPMIYSSQELGYMNTLSFFEYNVMDFRSENTTRDALVAIMKAYHQTQDLRGGKQTLGSLATRVPYVEYTLGEKTLLVICNTANSEQEVKLPMRYEGVEVQDLLTGEKVVMDKVTTLKSREYRIYKKGI